MKERDAESNAHSFTALARDATFVVIAAAVLIGFAHEFAYLSKLGVQVDLGEEPITQLAVSAMEAIIDNGTTALALIALSVAALCGGRACARFRWWRVPQATVALFVVATALGVMTERVYSTGAAEGQTIRDNAPEFGGVPNVTQIEFPSDISSHTACAAFMNGQGETKKANGYWLLAAESKDAYHLVSVGKTTLYLDINKASFSCFKRVTFFSRGANVESQSVSTPTPAKDLLPDPRMVRDARLSKS